METRITRFDVAANQQAKSASQQAKRKLSGEYLRKLRNQLLKSGDTEKAGAVATAQLLLKDGHYAKAELRLHQAGLDDSSMANRSTFPNLAQCPNNEFKGSLVGSKTKRVKHSARVCHNLKGEALTSVSRDSLMGDKLKVSKRTSPANAQAWFETRAKMGGCHYRGSQFV